MLEDFSVVFDRNENLAKTLSISKISSRISVAVDVRKRFFFVDKFWLLKKIFLFFICLPLGWELFSERFDWLGLVFTQVYIPNFLVNNKEVVVSLPSIDEEIRYVYLWKSFIYANRWEKGSQI